MRVIINGKTYDMGNKQAGELIELAGRYLACGIYAVEKDGICELKNEKFETAEELQRAVKEYEDRGFKVRYNEA